ncbi:monovalent cation/H+ antiporter subunit A [Inhella sp.]|uniref:monovalent cation/H+ antiporter subunit A n=1 Tax=Inhella sp. TaxID=1921806 RepID=UPI0035B256B5
MTLWALAAMPWLGALLLALLPPRRVLAAAVAGAVALTGLALTLSLAPAVFEGQVPAWRIDWLPQLGMALGFRVDGLAWLLAFLITGIGALIVLYGAWYLSPKDPAPRFFTFLLLFMGAMLGVVLADNLLLLVLFWELTSLSSFLLIGYWHHRHDARQGARMALTLTGAGGLCLLAGVLLIGHIVGSMDLATVLGAREQLQAHPLFPVALVLVLLGAFTKSAQFPFHFWLPHAMAAPTPVSAYLHSATMVKAGVFLLARMYPLLGGNEWWFWIVSLTGLATLCVGAYVAMFQHDLKGLLAYSTISHLGLITLLFGLDEPLAVVAGVFHLVNHATFKASLFMSAGIIDHETGTRDLRKLAGLMKFMPVTATLGMVAAASMAGVPLLNGFLSKEMFFTEAVAKSGHGFMEWLLPVGATVAGIFSVAYSLRFIHDTFFNGEPKDLPKSPHEAPFFMLLPVGVLVVLCVVVGVAPGPVVGPLLAVAAQAALGAPLPDYHLAIWHGFNLPLLMSCIAVAGGVALYAYLHSHVKVHRLHKVPGWIAQGGKDVFQALLAGGVGLAGALTTRLESGSLQRYLLLLVLAALAAGAWPFLSDGPSVQAAAPHWKDLNPGVAAVGLIGIAATVATTVLHAQRLLALVLMGATGLVVCLCFVYFSAPDLALTQLLVEMVTIILMMLALHWLPAESPPESARWRRWRDALIALAVGLGVAALVWLVLTREGQSISDYYLATSLPLGGGANAVNVIIVDYRGFDTLGEITVLVIAALTMHALLRGMPALGQIPDPGAHPLMLQLISRLVLPFTFLISFYLYLRGHNLPGGGFVAGLVLAIGLLLQSVAHGQHWVAQRGGLLDHRAWAGWGLLIAALTGAAAWLFGAPFLTSTYDYPWLPVVGGVPLASAASFDLGVLLVVAGATLVMLLSIARLARRST